MSQKWLRDYDKSRNRGYKTPNESFISTKYDFQNTPWKELQQTYVPELKMNIGKSISALKKNWRLYRMDDGREPRSSIAYKIVRLESALGLEKSDFPDLEGINIDEEFASEEELQLKREEQAEMDQGVDWDNWGAKISESEDDDWNFEKFKLGERENEDWWIS